MKPLFTVTFIILLANPALASSLGEEIGRPTPYGEFTGEYLSKENPLYPYDVQNNKPHTFYADTYTVITHADPIWDTEKVSQKGIDRLTQFSKNHGIQRVGLIGTETEQLYKPEDVDFKVASGGGQHRLKFPNSRNFFIAGGHLGQCLCEGIRDVIKGTNSHPEPLNLIFVSDAIYDYHPTLYANSTEITTEPAFPEDIRSSKFDANDFKITLQRLVELDTKKPGLLESYLDLIIMGGNSKFFCNSQNTYNFKRISLEDINLSVSIEGRFFKKYGSAGGQEISINITPSTKLDQEMQNLGLTHSKENYADSNN